MKNNQSAKTAIITGSSTGLGAYLCERLSSKGYNVVINYLKSKNEAMLLGKKLSRNGNILIVKGDVSKFTDMKNLTKRTLERFGKIDVLVNNAGIHVDSTVSKMTAEAWRNVIDTNLNGTFNCIRSVLPLMKEQMYGRIINISSFTAFAGIPGAANYSASKAGIIGLTKSLAKEVAAYGITVNSIAPGYFDIGMFNDFTTKQKEVIISNIPAKRLGNPSEISDLLELLIASSYLTGQTFVLDGGYSS